MTDRRRTNGGKRPGAGRPRQQTPAEAQIIMLIEAAEERCQLAIGRADAYQTDEERRLRDIELAYRDGLEAALKALQLF
jgi:hypothetical protein